MIYTSRVGRNAPVFLDILKLYVPEGANGCDVTFGRGAFWTPEAYAHVGPCSYFTDIKDHGIDLSALPYGDSTLEWHVLDPPYVCGFFRPKKSNQAYASHSDFADRYGNRGDGYKGFYYHTAVEAIYRDGLIEAHRVLRVGGIQITKCMDEVSNHKQHLTHCYVTSVAEQLGFEVLDLFIVTRTDKPHGLLIHRQQHARKNHSYFLVFRKL